MSYWDGEWRYSMKNIWSRKISAIFTHVQAWTKSWFVISFQLMRTCAENLILTMSTRVPIWFDWFFFVQQMWWTKKFDQFCSLQSSFSSSVDLYIITSSPTYIVFLLSFFLSTSQNFIFAFFNFTEFLEW